MRMIPSGALVRFVLGIALLTSVVATASAQVTKPNIIFILADDLGYGELGSYGQQQLRTPNLDRFAAEGMRFTQFYAGSTVCAPSRSVLMTGKHTGHTTVRGNASKIGYAAQTLRADEVTVARVLRDGGYATGLIGKWGLGESDSVGAPWKQGFGYFFGFINSFLRKFAIGIAVMARSRFADTVAKAFF
eukprot:gene21302-41325_t